MRGSLAVVAMAEGSQVRPIQTQVGPVSHAQDVIHIGCRLIAAFDSAHGEPHEKLRTHLAPSGVVSASGSIGPRGVMVSLAGGIALELAFASLTGRNRPAARA